MKGKARRQKKVKEKERKERIAQEKTIKNNPHNSQEKAIHNNHRINNNITLNLRHHNIHCPQLNKFPKATTRAMGNNGAKEARLVNKFQYIRSMTTTTITMKRTHTHGTIRGIRNGTQKETSINNGLDKKLDRFFNNHSL
eukprot:6218539-Amphidinium_carterae.4